MPANTQAATAAANYRREARNERSRARRLEAYAEKAAGRLPGLLAQQRAQVEADVRDYRTAARKALEWAALCDEFAHELMG